MAIHIKPSHKGRLTAKATRAGQTPLQFAHSHLHDKNVATRRQAVFAVNASKWSHNR